MSIFKNLLNAFVPVREQRRTTGTLAALNAELVLDVNGDESMLIDVKSGGAVTATISFQGSVNGTDYFPILAMPYYALTGTLPIPSQPLISEAFAGIAPTRVYALDTGQLAKVRVIATAYTSGSLSVAMNSGPEASIHPHMKLRGPSLEVTVTAATGIIATATLPAVTGLRHYIDRIDITRSATALLTAGAAPTVVTTTNLPGTPAFTFGADAAAQGNDKNVLFASGSTGLAALLAGTATTIVCPATTGVIWRVNVTYRLGL